MGPNWFAIAHHYYIMYDSINECINPSFLIVGFHLQSSFLSWHYFFLKGPTFLAFHIGPFCKVMGITTLKKNTTTNSRIFIYSIHKHMYLCHYGNMHNEWIDVFTIEAHNLSFINSCTWNFFWGRMPTHNPPKYLKIWKENKHMTHQIRTCGQGLQGKPIEMENESIFCNHNRWITWEVKLKQIKMFHGSRGY